MSLHRSFGGAAVAALLAIAALAPADAGAAACAGGMTVAGQPVTGDDCVTAGDGSITITNPKFGTAAAITLKGLNNTNGKMILNAAKTAMAPENVAIPLQLSVGTKPVMFGVFNVGNFELCDIQPAAPPEDPTLTAVPPDPDAKGVQARVKDEAGKTAGAVFQPAGVGCRTIPAFKLDFSSFNELTKILGLDLGKFSAKIPTVAGFDDLKGGRIFTSIPLKLPKTFDQEVDEGGTKKSVPSFIALGIEVSVDEGVKPTSTGFRINRSIPFGKLGIPGVSVDQLSGVIDPSIDRFGGQFHLNLPGNRALGAQLQLEAGKITQLGGDVTLPVPIPLGPANITSLGGTFTQAQSVSGPGGVTRSAPATIQGRAKFTVGPALGSASPLQGDVSLTIAGPSYKLAGVLSTAFGNKQVKLGEAKVLLVTDPFRFEAEASATIFDIITAHAFVGIVPQHFTALGEAKIVVPADIKFIGGQTLGGFQMALSEVGVGALITIDPPVFDPFSVGLGTNFSPFKLKKINSIAPFITVTPTAKLVTERASTDPIALAAAQKKVKLPKGLNQVIVTVVGTKRVPRGVKLTSAGGKLKPVSLGTGEKSVELGLVKPPKGELTVKSRDKLARIVVSRIKPFPYLDPTAGFGSQPNGPIAAGQPAHVCWKIKNAPKGAVVDIFEDQNGNLGTGRQLANGRPATGCFDVPTGDFEPGRHWVYGGVRVGSQPLNQRYWPIPITITDPTALPAPGNLTVTPTADGANVAWSEVDGASSYVVRAEPVDDQRGEPIEQDVAGTASSAELSLRGAKDWNIFVQAIDASAGHGNLAGPVAVTPTDGVLLAGKPNGVAEVGKPWAFQLETGPGVTLKLISGPAGMTLVGNSAQLRWTPAKQAGAAAPQQFVVEGCKGDRCVQRTFYISAYSKGFAPFGPARGFQVTPNVVKTGALVTIRAQGIDAKPVVKIDGKAVKGVKVLNAGALEFKAPKLAAGAHDVSLKIGSDAEERKVGALVVF
jgi:hypothetical protein